MNNLTFTFRSGYTIKRNPRYHRMTLFAVMQAWEDNPKNALPGPPTKTHTQPNGETRDIVLEDSQVYLASIGLHNRKRQRAEERYKIRLGFDKNSIDHKLVADHNAEMEALEIPTLDNDVEQYLMLVSEPAVTGPLIGKNGKPEKDKAGNEIIGVVQQSEIQDLFDWLDNSTGNQSAVMQRHLPQARATFPPNNVEGQQHLGSTNQQPQGQQIPITQPTNGTDGDGSGQPLPTVTNLVGNEWSG